MREEQRIVSIVPEKRSAQILTGSVVFSKKERENFIERTRERRWEGMPFLRLANGKANGFFHCFRRLSTTFLSTMTNTCRRGAEKKKSDCRKWKAENETAEKSNRKGH